jgi:hypothetical protein
MTRDPLRDPRIAYRWAIGMGWKPDGAGQLAAYIAGMRLRDDDGREAIGWSWRGLSRLMFLRHLRQTGRLAGDTEA